MNNLKCLQVGSIHCLPSHVPPPLPQVTFRNHFHPWIILYQIFPNQSLLGISCGNATYIYFYQSISYLTSEMENYVIFNLQ